jgi:2',3'-cyclic-nucleotide 2'-phosphodiesterase (5'-nucleotidase family)
MIDFKYAIYLGLFLLLGTGCTPKVNHLAYTQERVYRIDEREIDIDPSVEEIIAPYRENLAKTMHVVIANSSEEIYKEKPNSALLNFMADILLEGARMETGRNDIDLAIQNYGGIRVTSLPKGNITRGNIYELMPFDNTIVIMETPGSELKLLLDRIADYGGWPISKGTSFKIIDERYADSIYVNHQPFDINKTYVLALPDYIANGGDKTDFFHTSKKTDTGILIRDIIIKRLEDWGKVLINHEIRIFE